MDPMTFGSAVIGSVVSLAASYMQYRAAVEAAKKEGKEEPKKTNEVDQGEKALLVVETAVEQNGNDDERADLANFKRNPQRYSNTFQRAIHDLAVREPQFAQQLQTLAAKANVQGQGAV